MMQIILNINKKQFIVQENTVVKIEKVNNKIGDIIYFTDVLMLINTTEEKVLIGNPFITNISVKAEIIEHIKNKKIKIIKFRRRKHYKLTKGHRQPMTLIKIKEIYFLTNKLL